MSFDGVTDRHEFNWLLGNFVHQTDGVREAVAVSSDGLLIASSDGLTRTDADHLAAIVSSLTSLGRSAARRYDFDGLKLVMIEMNRGFLLVSAIAGGSCLGVVAEGDCDLGLIGFEISTLATRFGTLLTPELVSQSREQLPNEVVMNAPGHESHSHDAEGAAFDDLVIRPFLLTGGRTRPTRDDLLVEALVQARAEALQYRTNLRFEARAIVELCAEPISVAELSSRLRVPLGVVRVLVSDLITDSLVTLVARPELSVQTIERIRDRVRAL